MKWWLCLFRTNRIRKTQQSLNEPLRSTRDFAMHGFLQFYFFCYFHCYLLLQFLFSYFPHFFSFSFLLIQLCFLLRCWMACTDWTLKWSNVAGHSSTSIHFFQALPTLKQLIPLSLTFLRFYRPYFLLRILLPRPFTTHQIGIYFFFFIFHLLRLAFAIANCQHFFNFGLQALDFEGQITKKK